MTLFDYTKFSHNGQTVCSVKWEFLWMCVCVCVPSPYQSVSVAWSFRFNNNLMIYLIWFLFRKQIKAVMNVSKKHILRRLSAVQTFRNRIPRLPSSSEAIITFPSKEQSVWLTYSCRRPMQSTWTAHVIHNIELINEVQWFRLSDKSGTAVYFDLSTENNHHSVQSCECTIFEPLYCVTYNYRCVHALSVLLW